MSIKDNIKAIFLICKCNINKLFKNLNIYIVFILLFILLWYLISPIIDMSKVVGIKITPWIYPHVTSDSVTKFFLMLGLIVVFIDAPFVDDSYKYIVIRSGRKRWIYSSIIYIFITTALYFLIIYFLTVLISLPNLFISTGWGKYMTSLGNNPIDTGSVLYISSKIITLYSAIKATLISLFFDWIIGCILILILYIFSLKKKKILGLIVSIGIIFMDMAMVLIIGNQLLATRISPLSMGNLSIIEIKKASGMTTINYSITVLCIAISILTVMAFFIGRKTYIDEEHK